MRRFATTPHPKALAAPAAPVQPLGSVSASNMHDGRWMFTRRIDPEEHNGNQCTIIGIRTCDGYEAVQIVEWLAERAAGYPPVKSLVDNPQF